MVTKEEAVLQSAGWTPDDVVGSAGLPQFLRFLSTLPAPDNVARALLLGPLSVFDAGAASITQVRGEALELNGTSG